MKLKRLAIFAAAIVCLVDLSSCGTTSFTPPPPVTAEFARAGAHQHVDLAALREGRTLFVSRCIECHTLPAVSQHSATEWPRLIDEMAGRANLKSAERDAVLAYILVAHSQSR
jgi:mono/diheme cytochrome c family protein